MPAELYFFKLNPEEMSFGEQMEHIADANVFRFQQITGIKPPYEVDFSKPRPSDKETVMKRLEQSFDYVVAALPQITTEQLKQTWHIPSWKGRNDPDGRAMIYEHVRTHRVSSGTVRSLLAGKGDQAARLYVVIGSCAEDSAAC